MTHIDRIKSRKFRYTRMQLSDRAVYKFTEQPTAMGLQGAYDHHDSDLMHLRNCDLLM